MIVAFVTVTMACLAAAPEPALVAGWEFDTEAEARAWTPNSGIGNVAREEGVLSFDASGSDPFFTCRGQEIPARPCQFVVVRLKADQPGRGQLYWTSQTSGPLLHPLPAPSCQRPEVVAFPRAGELFAILGDSVPDNQDLHAVYSGRADASIEGEVYV